MTQFSEEAIDILKQYAAGCISAEAAAYEIWKGSFTDEPDPRAGDIIVWSKSLGFGIPTPTDKDVARELAAFEKFRIARNIK